MEEIKRCPFCGSLGVLEQTTYGDWLVKCANDFCFVHPHTGYYAKADKAIKYWNIRRNN